MAKLKNLSKGTVVRSAVLLLALINTSLQLFGVEVLPFTSEDVEIAVTTVLNVGAALVAWWKNNSFTSAAIEGDKRKDYAKAKETK